jgi:hypothetical protein
MLIDGIDENIDGFLKQALSIAALATTAQSLAAAKKIVRARLKQLEAVEGFPVPAALTVVSGGRV